MSVERMCRLRVLALDTHAPAVVAGLAALGEVEFLSPSTLPEWGEEEVHAVDVSRLLPRVAPLARRAADLAGALGAPARSLPTDAASLARSEAALESADLTLAEAEAALEAVEARSQTLAGQIQELGLVRETLQAMRGLDIDVSTLRTFGWLALSHARVPNVNLGRLVQSLADRPALVLPLGRTAQHTVVLLAYPRSESGSVDAALSTLLAERAVIPHEVEGAPDAALARVDDLLAEADLARRRLLLEREGLAIRYGRQMSDLRARLAATRSVVELKRLLAGAGRARLMSAWVPDSALGEATEIVARASATTAVVSVDRAEPSAGAPARHDAGPPHAGQARRLPPVPTRLRNPAILRPFEGLVTMYGQPAYGEVDPTPFVAVSFVLMWGMMFGDLGQGALLFAAGWGLRAWAPKLRDTSVIVRCVGASAMLFGCLYGEAFGWHFIRPLWLSPMEDTLHFLVVAAKIGVGLLSVGLVLNLVNSARHRDLGELLFGRSGLAGIWLYWGTLVAFVVIGIRFTLLAVLGLWVVPMLLMFFREPLANAILHRPHLLEGSPGEFFVTAFFELLETAIGYLSNTISFVRLAAFALNHAGLFTVVFLLTKMVDVGQIHGWVDALILILGNVFIIALEGLIVTIQALRLEYYEFFSKFFRGTGTPFRPVRLDEDASPGAGQLSPQVRS
jgi:V/A-type H+/Na+-transporting ATPase subunit I